MRLSRNRASSWRSLCRMRRSWAVSSRALRVILRRLARWMVHSPPPRTSARTCKPLRAKLGPAPSTKFSRKAPSQICTKKTQRLSKWVVSQCPIEMRRGLRSLSWASMRTMSFSCFSAARSRFRSETRPNLHQTTPWQYLIRPTIRCTSTPRPQPIEYLSASRNPMAKKPSGLGANPKMPTSAKSTTAMKTIFQSKSNKLIQHTMAKLKKRRWASAWRRWWINTCRTGWVAARWSNWVRNKPCKLVNFQPRISCRLRVAIRRSNCTTWNRSSPEWLFLSRCLTTVPSVSARTLTTTAARFRKAVTAVQMVMHKIWFSSTKSSKTWTMTSRQTTASSTTPRARAGLIYLRCITRSCESRYQACLIIRRCSSESNSLPSILEVAASRRLKITLYHRNKVWVRRCIWISKRTDDDVSIPFQNMRFGKLNRQDARLAAMRTLIC